MKSGLFNFLSKERVFFDVARLSLKRNNNKVSEVLNNLTTWDYSNSRELQFSRLIAPSYNSKYRIAMPFPKHTDSIYPL